MTHEGGPPAALHAEPLDITVNARTLHIEANIQHQIDRIGYLRSIGQDWQEPLFHLRDLVVGLEDDEFWTGFPKGVDVGSLTDGEREIYEERGWDTTTIDTEIDGEDETPCPTPQQLSKLLRIIMALLARQGVTWRSHIEDEIPTMVPTVEDD